MENQASLEPLLRTRSDESSNIKGKGDRVQQEVAKSGTEKSSDPSTIPTNDTKNSLDHQASGEANENKWKSFQRFAIDLLMFCSLLTSDTVLWNFPSLVLDYGGFYFMFIYLFMLIALAFPLLHLEIFVGQNCQAGIFKTCRSFGPAYGGCGFTIIFASAFCSLQFIQSSFINFLHIRTMVSQPELVYSCRAQNEDMRFRYFDCISDYDTQWCKKNNFSKFLGKECVPADVNFTASNEFTAIIGSVQRYYQFIILAPNADFDICRLFYTFLVYCLLAFLGCLGTKVIRVFLAVTYLIFVCLFLFVFFNFLSIADFRLACDALVKATTPESLYDRQTYVYAFFMSLITSGLGILGILCACSFRDQNSDTFRLAYGVTFNNLIVSFMSVTIFACTASAFHGRFKLLRESFSTAGYYFGMVATAEAFALEGRSTSVLIPYYCCVLVLTVLSCCGPLFMICALVRDTVQRYRHLWRAWAVTVFCLTTFLFSVPYSITSVGRYWELAIDAFYGYVIYFVEIMMVLIFVVVYGEREYAIDMSQLYPIGNGYRPWSSPAHPVYLRMLNIGLAFLIVLMAMHFALALTPALLGANRVYTNTTYGFIGVALALILGILTYSSCGNIRRNEGLSALFFVTPEHPSYWRITSLDVEVEEIGISEE